MSEPPRRPPARRPRSQADAAARSGTTRPAGPRLPTLLLVAATLALVTFVAFSGALNHAFVDWDDHQYVVENPLVLGQHYGALLRTVVANNYHPLTMLSLAWNVASPLSPRPFIATNLALHVADTLLVFWLAWLLSRRKLWVAAFVALLFGIHPMHVESVAWVSGRKDVLYALFFLSGLIAYWRYLDRHSTRLLFLSLALFILSCLAKGMAVVFPVVMVLLDLWKRRPPNAPRVLVEKLPFLAVALLFGAITLDAQAGGDFHGLLPIAGKHTEALATGTGFTPLERLTLPAYAYLMYVMRLIVPIHLAALYPYPAADQMERPVFLLAPLFLFGTLALALWDLRRGRILTFGIGWFLVNVALVLQWVPVGRAIMADRYTYVSYIGLFFILAMGLQRLTERDRRFGLASWAAGGVFAGLLFVQTGHQVATWKDSEALWNREVELQPRFATGYVYRGKHRAQIGREVEAQSDFRTALRLGLESADVFEGLGITYGALGHLDSAVVMLDRAIAADSSRGMLYYNRAVTYLALERPRQSLGDIDRALALMPDHAATLGPLRGYADMQLKDFRAAAAEFDHAIAAGGYEAALFFNRGYCRLQLGDRKGAADDFRATLRIDRNHVGAKEQLAALGG
jgi:protein O-mannosyl-transferase